jgi:hypothetical protein
VLLDNRGRALRSPVELRAGSIVEPIWRTGLPTSKSPVCRPSWRASDNSPALCRGTNMRAGAFRRRLRGSGKSPTIGSSPHHKPQRQNNGTQAPFSPVRA